MKSVLLLACLSCRREIDLLLQVVAVALVLWQEDLELLRVLEAGLGDLGEGVRLGRQHLLPELGGQLADELVDVAGLQELALLDFLHLSVAEQEVLVLRHLWHDLEQLFLHLGRSGREAWVRVPSDL